MTSCSVDSVLSVSNLSVTYGSGTGSVAAVKDVTFHAQQGESIALVGESGSGKSTLARALMGLTLGDAAVSGSITVAGREVVGATPHQLQQLRRSEVAMVLQDPQNSLHPTKRVGAQMREAASNRAERPKVEQRAIQLLERVGFVDTQRIMRSYSHELSGGECQRVCIAMSLLRQPRLLIADEPTSGLDVSVQAMLIRLLQELLVESSVTLVFVTHDLGVAETIAGRVLVMKDGHVVETGSTGAVFSTPQHEYTKRLLEAVPSFDTVRTRVADSMDDVNDGVDAIAFRVEGLRVEYQRSARRSKFIAVDDVDLVGYRDEFVGLVGESGSGKSTIARCVVGLQQPTAGSVLVRGKLVQSLTGRRQRQFRQTIGFVFQNPRAALDPRLTLVENVAERLSIGGKGESRSQIRGRAMEMLGRVKIARNVAHRFPGEVSGGQLQRAAIARALISSPKLLIADEPTSALDVSVQADIVELLQELHQLQPFACLFVSHDLALVSNLCQRIIVLRRGAVMEVATSYDVINRPGSTYTQELLSAAKQIAIR